MSPVCKSVLICLISVFTFTFALQKESFYACLRGCRLERIEQVSQNLGKLPKTPEKTCEKGNAIADTLL